MKTKKIILIVLCALSLGVSAQKLNWYSYWGSSTAGSQIQPVKMVVDKDGNIFTASLFGGSSVSVLDQTVPSLSSSDKGDAIITKMTAQKTQLWNRPLVGSGTATISQIAIDGNNNLIAAGTFTGTLQPDATHSMPMQDPTGYAVIAAYVVRYDSNGGVLNMWQLPSEGMTVGGISVDANNNIIISGTFGSEMSFNPSNFNSMVGSIDYYNQFYVAKYTPQGTLLWVNYTQDATATYSNAFVKADKDGSIYVGGTFTGTTTFANTQLATATGVNNIFFLKYDSNGTALWAKRIGGTRNDLAVTVETSDFGDVAVCGNYYSEDITVTGTTDVLQNGFAKTGDAIQYHMGVFTFNKATGAYRWWYSYGQGSTVNGGGGIASYLHCSNEGVWYLGGQTSGRFGDLYTYDNFAGNSNSGVKLVDGTWVQHNTNGGGDAIYLVLNREGKLCSIARPGGTQTETLTDLALSPDKKSVYFLYNMVVRDAVIYTCVNNLWDSYTDIVANGRQSMYNLIQVFCPEAPSATNAYTAAFKGTFNSTLIAKYDLPGMNPTDLPPFTKSQAYSQVLSLVSPQGASKFYQIAVPDELNFSQNTLSGIMNTIDTRYFGVIATDSTANPGTITYYSQDPNHISIRGNSRNVRYMMLKATDNTDVRELNSADAIFYPSVCSAFLYLKTNETNFSVKIFNQVGAVVGNYRNQFAFSTKSLPAGIYYVRLQTDKGEINTSKFIVK